LALRLVSLFVVLPIVVANGYWASMPEDNVGSIESPDDGTSSSLGLFGACTGLSGLILFGRVAAQENGAQSRILRGDRRVR
jgi:hypothetical protein